MKPYACKYLSNSQRSSITMEIVVIAEIVVLQAALGMQGTRQASGGWGWLGASDGAVPETSNCALASTPTDDVFLLQGP